MAETSLWLPAWTLCRREVTRFFRQRSRVVGAVAPPLIFWFLIGSGLGGSFRHGAGHLSESFARAGGINYLQYFFPGTIAMVVLFTAVFSTISVIEDRREGFLQSVLAAPISPSALALGNLLGGSWIAFVQGAALLLLAPTVGISFHAASLFYAAGILAALCFGLTGLGFLIAWRMDSTQGFHAIMNLLLMPMWFLSGALFPLESAPSWLKALMVLDPMTYGVAGLKDAFYSDRLGSVQSFPGPWTCWTVSWGFAGIMFLAAVAASRRRSMV